MPGARKRIRPRLPRVCKTCAKPFTISQRRSYEPNGGLYCSPRCNPAKWPADDPKERKRHNDRKRRYGIPAQEFQSMLDAQGYACAICGRKDSGSERHKNLVVDHCHRTNGVRALLCQPCNAGLGQFGDNPHTLLNATKYLIQKRKQDVRANQEN